MPDLVSFLSKRRLIAAALALGFSSLPAFAQEVPKDGVYKDGVYKDHVDWGVQMDMSGPASSS